MALSLPRSKDGKKNSWLGLTSILVLSNLLVFQVTYNYRLHSDASVSMPSEEALQRPETMGVLKGHEHPLDMRQGKAKALPSVRVKVKSSGKEVQRTIYGGEGDKPHLGGFTKLDVAGISPTVWKDMITWFGVRSVLDVGCGLGTSSLWFQLHGVDTLCVEGSHDAVQNSHIREKKKHIVEHDFSRGPWWPEKTYDAIWCVEFLEHVGRNFHHNYLPTFRKAALIFATHSTWGGWHHVEVHDELYWISKFESFGFHYSARLSERVRKLGLRDRQDLGPTAAQHIRLHMLVFINPAVASLPEHSHLFAETGCFQSKQSPKRRCGFKPNGERRDDESILPESFEPLKLTPKMDRLWEKIILPNGTEELSANKTTT